MLFDFKGGSDIEDTIQTDITQPKTNNKNMYMIILVVVVVLMVCFSCCSLLLMLSNKKSNPTKTDDASAIKCNTCACSTK
jgi:flagellar basal body-associated protein FliL